MTAQVERAAGGFVVRGPRGNREVLCIDDMYGKMTFPKGHLERGESWETAALREIEEETGIRTRVLASLGRIEYPVLRNGRHVKKQVRFFLLEALEETAPQPQVEEIKAAYYLPLTEAEERHERIGYANWSFVFQKAKALLDWMDGDFETRWRTLSAEAPQIEIDTVFQEAKPIVESIVAACREELQVTMPELTLSAKASVMLPRTESSVDDVRAAVESTLLKPEASEVDIGVLCAEAEAEGFPLVCINPQHVSFAARLLAGGATRVCTVIGFPLGAVTPDALAVEVAELTAKGATEVDMVIPVGSMAEDDVRTVYHHVARVVRTAKSLHPSPAVKVILETSALSLDQVVKAALVSVAAGADFIKTSTGFHRSGATVADVSAMTMAAAGQAGVKASGGVRSGVAARQLLRYGADRLGTSSGPHLVR